MSRSDAECIRKVLSGEREAFDTLVAKYAGLAGAVAYGVLGDPEAAEDVIQESFVKAYARLGDLRTPERFRPWFTRIVRREALDTLRRRRRDARRTVSLDAGGGGEDGLPLAGTLASSGADPLEGFLEEEKREKILEALGSLPLEDRIVLVLKHMEGLSYREIAEITQATESAVESRLFRARRVLRRKLEQYLKSDS